MTTTLDPDTAYLIVITGSMSSPSAPTSCWRHCNVRPRATFAPSLVLFRPTGT